MATCGDFLMATDTPAAQNMQFRAQLGCRSSARQGAQSGGSACSYQVSSVPSGAPCSSRRPAAMGRPYIYASPPREQPPAHAADRVFLDCRGALASLSSCLPHGDRHLAVELIEGHGAGGEREPGRDARMPPGSRTGLRDGRAAGRVPADPGRSGAGRRTPARNHRVGRGSGRRPDARERRGGAGRCGPGSPGYGRVRLPGASRPVVPSR